MMIHLFMPIKKQAQSELIPYVGAFLIAFLLFLSGFFVFLTPLPLFILLIKPKRFYRSFFIVLSFLLLFFLYLVAYPKILELYQNNNYLGWILFLPGMDLSSFVDQASIALYGILSFTVYLFMALIIKRAYLQKKTAFDTLKWGSIVLFAGIMITLFVYSSLKDLSVYSFLKDFFESSFNQFFASQNKEELSLKQLAFLQQHKDDFINYSIMLMPSFLFMVLPGIILLNIYVGRRFLASYQALFRKVQWNRWQLGFSNVWLFILFLALFLIQSNYYPSTSLLFISLNALFILAFLFFLQGLAIISFYFEIRKTPPLLRLLSYLVFIIFIQTLFIVVIAFGFFDSWYDFRKKLISKKEE